MSTASPSPNEDVQRWTAKRKAAVVLDIIKGKTTPVEVARQHGLTVAEVECKLPLVWDRLKVEDWR